MWFAGALHVSPMTCDDIAPADMSCTPSVHSVINETIEMVISAYILTKTPVTIIGNQFVRRTVTNV